MGLDLKQKKKTLLEVVFFLTIFFVDILLIIKNLL